MPATDGAAAPGSARRATSPYPLSSARIAGLPSRRSSASLLPSVSAIKLVETSPGRYVSFEGNGRLAALRSVFADDADLWVECEWYDIGHVGRLQRRIARLRQAHGLDTAD